MTRVVIFMAGCCLSGVFAIYGMYTVEIPAYSLLVKSGSTNATDIVAVFPKSTRLLVSDARLTNTDLLPYWRWEFEVVRDVELFRYGVTFSVMGSPEEGLKYRDKALANWHRAELEAWAGKMLHRFEADRWETWTTFRMPPTEAEEQAFEKALSDWFTRSSFADGYPHRTRRRTSLILNALQSVLMCRPRRPNHQQYQRVPATRFFRHARTFSVSAPPGPERASATSPVKSTMA